MVVALGPIDKHRFDWTTLLRGLAGGIAVCVIIKSGRKRWLQKGPDAETERGKRNKGFFLNWSSQGPTGSRSEPTDCCNGSEDSNSNVSTGHKDKLDKASQYLLPHLRVLSAHCSLGGAIHEGNEEDGSDSEEEEVPAEREKREPASSGPPKLGAPPSNFGPPKSSPAGMIRRYHRVNMPKHGLLARRHHMYRLSTPDYRLFTLDEERSDEVKSEEGCEQPKSGSANTPVIMSEPSVADRDGYGGTGGAISKIGGGGGTESGIVAAPGTSRLIAKTVGVLCDSCKNKTTSPEKDCCCSVATEIPLRHGASGGVSGLHVTDEDREKSECVIVDDKPEQQENNNNINSSSSRTHPSSQDENVLTSTSDALRTKQGPHDNARTATMFPEADQFAGVRVGHINSKEAGISDGDLKSLSQSSNTKICTPSINHDCTKIPDSSNTSSTTTQNVGSGGVMSDFKQEEEGKCLSGNAAPGGQEVGSSPKNQASVLPHLNEDVEGEWVNTGNHSIGAFIDCFIGCSLGGFIENAYKKSLGRFFRHVDLRERRRVKWFRPEPGSTEAPGLDQEIRSVSDY